MIRESCNYFASKFNLIESLKSYNFIKPFYPFLLLTSSIRLSIEIYIESIDTLKFRTHNLYQFFINQTATFQYSQSEKRYN